MIDFPQNYNLMIVGIGGQGLMTMGRFFRQYALENPEINDVVSMESRGVSQREGSVHVLIRYNLDTDDFPLKQPLRSLCPTLSLQSIHLMIALEPLEMLRNIQYVSPDGILILNTQEIIPKSCLTNPDNTYPNIEKKLNEIQKIYPNLTIIKTNYTKRSTKEFNDSIHTNELVLKELKNLNDKIFKDEIYSEFLKEFF